MLFMDDPRSFRFHKALQLRDVLPAKSRCSSEKRVLSVVSSSFSLNFSVIRPEMSAKQRRSKRTKLEAGSLENQTKASCPGLRILVLPKTLLKEEIGDSPARQGSKVIELRSPKSGNPELFLFEESSGRTYQMICFKEPPRSWLVNDAVSRGGSMVLTTEVDPLFLILPYLKECRMFRPLEQIVVDSEFPECVRLLSCKDLERRIKLVADVKELKDIRAYRFSTEKCADWLKSKMSKVEKELREREVHVAAGAQAATFVRNKKEKAAGEEDYRRYAHGMVSEFLPKEISDALLEQTGLSSPNGDGEPHEDHEPPKKRAKTSNAETGPVEDYGIVGASGLCLPEKKKLTTAQKALNKVDKTGMKAISSFFGKKKTK